MLASKYKHIVILGNRDTQEIINIIKNKFTIVEVNLFDIQSTIVRFLNSNVLHSYSNQKLALSESDFEYRVFKIINNQKSKDYYNGFHQPQIDGLFVVLEINTGYIYTNSNRLQLELMIWQGICKYHFTNETMVYWGYLNLYEHYENQGFDLSLLLNEKIIEDHY